MTKVGLGIAMDSRTVTRPRKRPPNWRIFVQQPPKHWLGRILRIYHLDSFGASEKIRNRNHQPLCLQLAYRILEPFKPFPCFLSEGSPKPSLISNGKSAQHPMSEPCAARAATAHPGSESTWVSPSHAQHSRFKSQIWWPWNIMKLDEIPWFPNINL